MSQPENTLSPDMKRLTHDGILFEASEPVSDDDSCSYCAFQSHLKDCCPRVADFGVTPADKDTTLLCREENRTDKHEIIWRLVGLDPRIKALLN